MSFSYVNRPHEKPSLGANSGIAWISRLFHSQRMWMILIAVMLGTSATSASEAPKCVPTLPAWVSPFGRGGLHPLPNTVTLRGRRLRWNSKSVSERQLSVLSRKARNLNPQPELVLRSDYADCAFAHHIEQLLKASYHCSGERCSQVMTR